MVKAVYGAKQVFSAELVNYEAFLKKDLKLRIVAARSMGVELGSVLIAVE